MYNSLDMAEARLNGFMDCVDLLVDGGKVTEEDLFVLSKMYRQVWLRHYMKEARDVRRDEENSYGEGCCPNG